MAATKSPALRVSSPTGPAGPSSPLSPGRIHSPTRGSSFRDAMPQKVEPKRISSCEITNLSRVVVENKQIIDFDRHASAKLIEESSSGHAWRRRGLKPPTFVPSSSLQSIRQDAGIFAQIYWDTNMKLKSSCVHILYGAKADFPAGNE